MMRFVESSVRGAGACVIGMCDGLCDQVPPLGWVVPGVVLLPHGYR